MADIAGGKIAQFFSVIHGWPMGETVPGQGCFISIAGQERADGSTAVAVLCAVSSTPQPGDVFPVAVEGHLQSTAWTAPGANAAAAAEIFFDNVYK
jgi:hypothetical protein